jgi:hypothetical protein
LEAGESLSSSCGIAGRPLRWNFHNATRYFRGELRDAGFDVTPGRVKFLRNTLFRPGHFGCALPSRFFQQLGALIKQSFAGSFLLNVNLGARLLQSFLVLFDFFRGGGLRGFRGFACSGGSRFTLGHYPKQRLEEECPQNAVKNEQDQDCRHSLKEQFAKLVNNLLHLACFA